MPLVLESIPNLQAPISPASTRICRRSANQQLNPSSSLHLNMHVLRISFSFKTSTTISPRAYATPLTSEANPIPGNAVFPTQGPRYRHCNRAHKPRPHHHDSHQNPSKHLASRPAWIPKPWLARPSIRIGTTCSTLLTFSNIIFDLQTPHLTFLLTLDLSICVLSSIPNARCDARAKWPRRNTI